MLNPFTTTADEPASLVESIHERFLPAVEPQPRAVAAAVDVAAPLLGRADAAEIVAEVLARLGGTGPLAQLWADEQVTEVMINGSGPVSVERSGVLSEVGRVSQVEVERLMEYLLGPTGRRADRLNPIVDVRLDDCTRCNIAVPPVAVDGPYITLRRFPTTARQLCDLADAPTERRLRELVAQGANLLVFGPTSSGKTSLLAGLMAAVGEHERIVIVEEAAELPRLSPNVIRLEGQPPNIDGKGAVSMSQLVVGALRMRPDRIVVGEVRGPEAADLLQALTTGHRGSMSTIHANSGPHALWRLEQLAYQGGATGNLRAHICSVIDAMVHMAKVSGGRRRVAEIVDVPVGGAVDVPVGGVA